MKRTLSFLLVLALVMSMTITAWATDLDSEQITENHTVITSWDDLIVAVNDAADGDVIYIGTNIEITMSTTIGSEDKHITLRLDSSCEDDLCDIFWTSSQYDNMEEITNTDLAFVNITFDGGNYRCCPLFNFNRGVTIKNCTFVNWNGYYGGGFISFGVSSLGKANSTIQNCIFDNIKTNIATINIRWGAEVEIDSCHFKNITGINGSVISNIGTAIVGENYYQNCVATNVNALIYNQNTLHLTTDMEAYESLYEATPYGWYCNYLFDEEGKVYQPDMMQPYNSDDSTLLCGLTLLMENPYPQPEAQEPIPDDDPPIETPTTPSEPPQDDNGDDTPDEQQPPSEPQETPNDEDGDMPNDDEQDEADDNDNEPTIIYRPVYIYVPVEPEPEEPEIVEPALICGDAVIDVSRSVVLEGYDDGLLHLEDGLTRAQFMTILYRLLDEDTIDRYETTDTIFADVAPDAWYCPYVNTIANAGIVCGTGNGNFDPEAQLTWAHIITILSRFVEQQECDLKNIQYDGWAADAVETAVALGWITDHAAFNPDATISRGELAYFVNFVLSLYR